MKKFGISQSIKRKEDPRLLKGEGKYVDDISPSNSKVMIFFRSPVAHAKILKIDFSIANKIQGILKIYDAKELKGKIQNEMDYSIIKNKNGKYAPKTIRPMLAEKKVNFVGEAILAIVAINKDIALNALETIDFEYEEYNSNVGLEDNSSLIHNQIENNLGVDWSFGNEKKVNDIFSKVKHKVKIDLTDNRVLANPIETRGCFAEYKNEILHLCYNGQGVWGTRRALSKKLKLSFENIRVSHPDVGGGFGMKSFDYPELFLVSLASLDLKSPVKWQADRQEGFLSDNDGRDLTSCAELALDKDYRILALKIITKCNLGAYCSGYAQFIQTELALKVLTGAYDIKNVFFSVKGYYTNTSPVDAYRGAGRPEAIYVLERLMDYTAKILKINYIDLRKRNFIKKKQMPYLTQSGELYDVGDFEKVLDKAMIKSDLKGFEKRKNKSKSKGKLRGIGLCFYIESILGDHNETTKIKFNNDSSVSLFVGTQSNGQGHETAYSQIFHEKTNIPFEKIKIIQGDTNLIQKGGGTGGSRSVTMQGNSINAASDLMIEKCKKLVTKIFKTNKQIFFKNGIFYVDKSLKKIKLTNLVNYMIKNNLDEYLITKKESQVDGRSYPYGAHFAEVEIDPETGKTKCVKYTVVDDFGFLINPMLAEGQVHGGVAQGIGQAITENVVFDKYGQLLSGSFMDYAIPRADDIPDIPFFTELIPSKANKIGMKGCGEAGTVGALAAVANATLDALWEIGVRKIDMPFTPFNVWKKIKEIT